ncbi:unnamed protein product [Ixodes persulcatus]
MANKSDCLVCFKGVSPDAAFLKCAECSNLYHIGKCSGVAKKAHKDMSVGALSAWICNTCKVNRQRLSGETNALTAQITEVNAKLMTVLNRIEKIEKALDVQGAKHDSILTKLEVNEEKVNGMETALAALNAQYEEIFKNSQNQGKLIEELAKKTTHLEVLIVERDAQILSLKTAVDNAEQYSRRKNIEIHGVKEYENENLVTVVTDLTTKLQLPPPTSQSIETAHRLRAREGRTAPIFVRFTERSTRDMWIKKRVSLKGEGIYVNENLTRTLKNLFWNTKKTAREKNYKFVWVRNGKIFVKEKDGSPVIRI